MFVILTGTVICATEKPIILRYANVYPNNHPFTKGDLDYQAKIIKETNGRVKFRNYFSKTLVSAREGYEDISKGVADMASFSGSYSKSGFTIARRISGFYHGIYSEDARVNIFKALQKKYPEYAKEYEKVKPMMISNGLHYQLQCKKPVRTIADMKGLQFKATATWIKILTALGAVGQNVPMGEVYIALQKGIIDGCMAPLETLKTFRFAEVVKGVTESPIVIGGYYSRGMNWGVWNKLPPDVQKVFDDNIETRGDLTKKRARATDQGGIDLAKKHGVVFLKFSKSDLARFYEVMDETCLVLAKDLDGKGLPGTPIYNDIRRMAKEAGY
ncbi:TRAP transporter substrate-binding protein DctP [Thermodesulfobacteriota bacterium]